MNKWYITLGFVLVAVLVVFSLGQNGTSNITQNSYEATDANEQPASNEQPNVNGSALGDVVPETLGDFTLVGLLVGEEALADIDRLHGTAIDIIDGIIAEYANDRGDFFVLWISESRDEEEAYWLFEIMDEMMPRSPTYIGRTEVTIANQDMIYVTSARMENYYWATGIYNYWIGIYDGDDEEIVELVIDNF
ncbi:hypothetical protein [Desulfuribacillus alkaliarsenatis]|uniref:Uncharacterized protein n=1 Tax=Desulfuribacillus alkaliarsenatis TaxID=766136 RepID=A0A1E5G0M5_9FIRM|nr:hypothetical protein [Desulfuribacillus alkaliarsenatis]OEF96462.1 hypothetical protein BHF68_07320 [Desulfuribacillus alkaliarsenatis]